ncbi:MAG: hypothetical protein PHF00_03435 [Elusimicrobia bacterium]|nr:hypothetical protein [Elusimicrobiota bacterium]
MWRFLLPGLCLALVPCAPAQEDGVGDEQQTAAEPAAPAPEPAEAEAKPMSLDDARVNFATVVENFILDRSGNGYWPLKRKTTGKALRLLFVGVDGKTVQSSSAGRYSGIVLLRQVDGPPVKAVFDVSFTQARWGVQSFRLLPDAPKKTAPPGKKPRASAKP